MDNNVVYFITDVSTATGSFHRVVGHAYTKRDAAVARTGHSGGAYKKRIRAHTAPKVGATVTSAWINRACTEVDM